MTTQLLQAIKQEITNDPTGRGYAGKTNLEIAALLNAPYDVDEVIRTKKPPRINVILSQVASAPNRVEAADVQAAKNN